MKPSSSILFLLRGSRRPRPRLIFATSANFEVCIILRAMCACSSKLVEMAATFSAAQHGPASSIFSLLSGQVVVVGNIVERPGKVDIFG